jgi:hypothetical protein
MSDSTQLSDQFLFQSSLKTEPEIKVSKHKSVVSTPDINQGSYTSGLITIDCSSSLNGSHGFASLKEAYLTLPYVITAKNTGTNNFASPLTRFAASLKSGVWNVISDLDVELDGKQVLSTNEYKNHWNNLRAMTETSVSDLLKHDVDRNLFLDDWYSINFSASADANGDGYTNNSSDFLARYDNTLGQTQENKSCNNAMVGRLNNALPVLDTLTSPALGWASLGKSAITQITAQHGRGCYVEKTTASTTEIAGIWVYVLKIKLTDLHPLFKEIDLLANPKLKLSFRVNAGTCLVDLAKDVSDPSIQINDSTAFVSTVNHVNKVASIDLGSTTTTMKLKSMTLTSGNVCPILISSGGDTQPMSNVCSTDASGNQIGFSFGPLQNEYSALSTVSQYMPYTTSRLNIPFYDIRDPTAIIQKPVKNIQFLDCFAQYFNQGQCGVGVSTSQLNADFSLSLSATKKNIKYIAVVPYADTSSGYWTETALRTQQFQSPFDTAPWTFMPGASIRNFQVQIGSENVFAKTHVFDYETFMDEFSKLSSINGDLSHEINCGLVNFNQWTYCQRVLIADCSRISEKDVPQSITISGSNSCSQGMNLMVFVVYQRELSVDRITGEVEFF